MSQLKFRSRFSLSAASRRFARHEICLSNTALRTSTIVVALFALSGCGSSMAPTAPSVRSR